MLKFIIRFPFILCAFAVSAKAGPYYDLSLHTSSATMKVSGAIKVAASSSTPNTPVITLDGANSLATIPEVHSAKSGPVFSWETGGATQSAIQGLFNFGFTSGFTIYDYQTPGNGRLGLGTPYGPQIYGKGYVGTPFLGINNSDPIHALDVTGGIRATSTMTASAYYGAGTGLTSIPAAQLAGSVPATSVDLSTVTTALAGKLSNTATVPTTLIDLSTVTTALAGKLSNTTTVPTTLVDLSTVTTALAGKQPTGTYITRLIGDVLAEGPGLVPATVAHVPTTAVDLSTVTTALAGKLSNTATVPTTLVDLSTVTTALDGKVAKAGDTMSGQLTILGSSLTINSDLLDYQLILTGGTKRNMKFDDRNANATIQALAGIDFLQIGTIKHQITAYGDTNASYPKEMHLGAAGTDSNVRITGNAGKNPGVFVSSWSSVGINTAAPYNAYKLDVNGNARVSGSEFSVGGSTLVVANGRVGVGVSPSVNLDVAGVYPSGPYINIRRTDGTASYGGLQWLGSGGTQIWAVESNNRAGAGIEINEGSSNRLYVAPGGNVGIGTAVPATTLDVYSANTIANSAGNMVVRTSNSGQAADIGGYITLGGNYTDASDRGNFAGIAGRKENSTSGNMGGYLTLNTTAGSNATTYERMRITSTGNVGIGTTGPGAKLHVQDGVILSSTTAGFGVVQGYGSSGGCLMFRDTDNAGWTECKFLDGVMSCATDADGVCD